jgi:hypothetical protein
MGGPQSLSGPYEVEEHFLPLSGIEPVPQSLYRFMLDIVASWCSGVKQIRTVWVGRGACDTYLPVTNVCGMRLADGM